MNVRDEELLEWPRSGEVVVFDLEWTAWEGSLARGWNGEGEHREVIQIGAVLLDAASFGERGELERLVRPAINPVLSDYVVRLTGITDAEIEARGTSFPTALSELVRFCGGRTLLCNGADGPVLRENCALTSVPYPFSPGQIRNLRPALARATGLAPGALVSSELPTLLGLPRQGAAHSAVADARAIARALGELRARSVL